LVPCWGWAFFVPFPSQYVQRALPDCVMICFLCAVASPLAGRKCFDKNASNLRNASQASARCGWGILRDCFFGPQVRPWCSLCARANLGVCMLNRFRGRCRRAGCHRCATVLCGAASEVLGGVCLAVELSESPPALVCLLKWNFRLQRTTGPVNRRTSQLSLGVGN